MFWWFKSLLFGLILLIFHSHFISSSSVQPECRPETRTALLNLTTTWYDDTVPNGNNTADCCDWDGVHCDSKTGHVTDLYLFNLNGTITSRSSLFSLIHLRSLAIYNDISKPLSVEIGSDAFDALTRNLTEVQYISFHNVNLSSVPPASLMNLSSSLTAIVIDSCQLTGKLAQNSFNFPNLRELELYDNNLQGPIPPWIYALPNLESLVLSSNNLSGTVELQELSKLKKLYQLQLSHNSLTFSNNCTNCTLEHLSAFTLSSCNLTEFPHFLRSSKHLLMLDLSNNQIQGIVPKWLNELRDLRFLDLRSNFFFGPLPNISSQFIYFFASKNQFSGEIPSSIFNITSSEMIDLSYNNLSGLIPPLIRNVENLLILDLQSNNLSGPIPESLFVEDSRLQSLNLNANQLQGQLPRSLLHCRGLHVLDLGNNQFNDTFPEWLGSLPHLQVLVLRANKFHGLIGNSPFQELRIMDLSHNDFTGALPTKYFDNFKAMNRSLDELTYMGDGELTYIAGYSMRRSYFYHESVRVTMKGVELELERIQNIFTTIDLSSNNFTGEIPELHRNLKSLKGLNLSHNMLTGILPPSLGNLTNLEWLDLSSNELVGKIPTELANINGHQLFNVSHNHLEGPIPVGKQFNTFPNESFEGNLNLCGFPLSKLCGAVPPLPLEPSVKQDDDEVTNWFNWRIVMMGFASGLVIGVSIGYILLYSNGKLHWLSATILEEIEYRRAISAKRRNVRRSVRK